MKKFVALSLLVLCGCFVRTKTEKLAPLLQAKTVMLNIPTYVKAQIMTIDKGGIRFDEKTVLRTFRCTGVLISETGHILTCDHCISAGRVLSINATQFDGTTQKAELLDKNKDMDLALLKVEGAALPYATIANPRSLAVGQDVIAVGYPMGLDFSVSKGILSAIHRTIDIQRDMTQSDTAINPGNSGGPLFNMAGELIGINSLMITPASGPVFTGLGFSVSPSQIKRFLAKFKGLDQATKA